MQHIFVKNEALDDGTAGCLDPQDLSLAFWMRVPAGSTFQEQYVVGKGRKCGGHYGCRVSTSGDKLACHINDATTSCASAVGAEIEIQNDVWQHIVFTVEHRDPPGSTHLRIYRNGVRESRLDVPQLQGVAGTSENFMFGRNPYYLDVTITQQLFHGQLADVRLYAGVLADAEVTALYSSSK